jgi:Protein of unknown function (DUF3551)
MKFDAVLLMRWALLAIAIAGTAMTMTMPTNARELPFCIRGCDFAAGRGDCSFASYQQCQATAAGRDAWCAENPYFNAKPHFNAEAESPSDGSRQSRRRF